MEKSKTDVLIIGAGPSGLIAATWMARMGINARIVDTDVGSGSRGQADGLRARTMEMLDSFGLADRVLERANPVLESAHWEPDSDGIIRRTDRIRTTPPGLSRFSMMLLHQCWIERFLTESLSEHSRISVERGVLALSLSIDKRYISKSSAYPVTVQLQHLTKGIPAEKPGPPASGQLSDAEKTKSTHQMPSKEGTVETVQAKFVIGCDGAQSWTRQQLKTRISMNETGSNWGVLDMIPITNFPDIGIACFLQSKDHGNVLMVPRPNRLVRFHVQLKDDPHETGVLDPSKITVETLLAALRKIFRPYFLTCARSGGWMGVRVTQMLNSKYDVHRRIFLADDAAHLQSPFCGQGMGVSMQDSYNLGWKIALVVRGASPWSILDTYESERKPVAEELIDFDTKLAEAYTAPAKGEIGGIADMTAMRKEALVFGNGFEVKYSPGMLVARAPDPNDTEEAALSPTVVGQQALAKNIPLGMRFPSYQVVNQATSQPRQFQQLLKSDGRFRIVLFAGQMADERQKCRVFSFCTNLQSENGLLRRITRAGQSFASVIDILTVHSSPRWDVDLVRDFPNLLRPLDSTRGYEYNKIFADDDSYDSGHGHAYQNYGVDPKEGCVVAVRPDQYVGYIGKLEDVADLTKYFDGIFV